MIAGTVKLFRNGVIVGECTGAPGVAAPDPCVATRQTLMDGDIQLTARTSSASIWSAGVPAPRLGTITVPAPVKAVGVVMTASATLTDSGALGGHVAVWNWGDGTTSAGTIPSGATGSAVVSGNHAFATPGIRTVTLTVTDPSGQRAVATFNSVVTYAATSVVTGSGTIVPGGPTSLPGDSLPGLNGKAKASIAIDLKYKKGATIPTWVGDRDLPTRNLQVHRVDHRLARRIEREPGVDRRARDDRRAQRVAPVPSRHR